MIRRTSKTDSEVAVQGVLMPALGIAVMVLLSLVCFIHFSPELFLLVAVLCAVEYLVFKKIEDLQKLWIGSPKLLVEEISTEKKSATDFCDLQPELAARFFPPSQRPTFRPPRISL